MKKLIKYILFLLASLTAAFGEVVLINSPLQATHYVHIFTIYFLTILLLTGEAAVLYSLPVGLLYLEQFTSLPFGVLSTAICLSLLFATLILKLLITNRSFTSISIISILTILIYTIILNSFIALQTDFSQAGGAATFLLAKTKQFVFESFSAWGIVTITYVLIARFSKRWNPKYIKPKLGW